jgi:hypothetical protein
MSIHFHKIIFTFNSQFLQKISLQKVTRSQLLTHSLTICTQVASRQFQCLKTSAFFILLSNMLLCSSEVPKSSNSDDIFKIISLSFIKRFPCNGFIKKSAIMSSDRQCDIFITPQCMRSLT